MARVITVANSKGGVGKSTITLNLANYFRDQGLTVAICDTDYQQTISGLDNVGADLISLDQVGRSGHQLTLVDTPAYRSEDLDQILRATDFCLIPIQPSLIDAKAAATVIGDVRSAGVKYGIVINRVKPSTSLTAKIRAALEAQGAPVMRSELGDRVAYQRAMIRGDLEATGDNKAEIEIANLAGEIFRRIAE